MEHSAKMLATISAMQKQKLVVAQIGQLFDKVMEQMHSEAMKGEFYASIELSGEYKTESYMAVKTKLQELGYRVTFAGEFTTTMIVEWGEI